MAHQTHEACPGGCNRSVWKGNGLCPVCRSEQPATTAGRPYRRCPDGSVVIDTEDVTDIVLEREDLLAMLDVNLAKVWNEGRVAGDQENDDFHTDREPIREAINPYTVKPK